MKKKNVLTPNIISWEPTGRANAFERCSVENQRGVIAVYTKSMAIDCCSVTANTTGVANGGHNGATPPPPPPQLIGELKKKVKEVGDFV